jgi:dTDP-4-dehydrorhamnose reductase
MAKVKVLITGASGLLAYALREAAPASADLVSLHHAEFDLTNRSQMAARLREHRPDVVINTAAFNMVDRCEVEREISWAVNATGPIALAELCGELGCRLVHYGTDYVFDGAKGAPYTEEDKPNPVNHYAAGKLAGELGVLAAGMLEQTHPKASPSPGGEGHPSEIPPGGRDAAPSASAAESFDTRISGSRPPAFLFLGEGGQGERVSLNSQLSTFNSPSGTQHLVLRVSWLFGWHPTQTKSYVHTVLNQARKGQNLKATTDQTSVPTYVTELARWTFELIERGATGLVHAINDEGVSRFEWTRAILEEAKNAGLGLPAVQVEPVTTAYFNPTMRRPNYTVLSNAKLKRLLGREIGSWRDGLRETLRRVQCCR